jgi:5-methylcytosine-specific restriction endonuclease McrA
MTVPESKACNKCGETKPLSSFHRDRSRTDGRHPWCAVCTRARRNTWYAENREANLAYQADWREDNKERKAASDRAYREANLEERRAHDRAYRAANAEARREADRNYYRANRSKWIEARARRRARLRGVETIPYGRREIFDRDGGQCKLCGVQLRFEPQAFQIDHIVPISLGGPDTPANVQLACPTCNRRKGASLTGQLHFAA